MKVIQFALFSLLIFSACTTQADKTNADVQQRLIAGSVKEEI